MNVSKALMSAILRQLVTTLKEVSPVLVTLDSQAMDPPVQVNESIDLILQNFKKPMHIISAVKYKYAEFSSHLYDLSLQM